MGNVAGALAGKHVLLTGVTGFVGEALLQLLLTEVPDVRLTLLIRPKGSTSRRRPGRGAARARTIFAGSRGRRRPADRPGLRARGRPGRRTRAARPTSTPSCTARATSPSTRPSTRGSAPTSSAPATCSTGSARPAATSTTCTSPRRTSPAGAAARIPEGRVDHAVDVEAELAWGLAQRTRRRAPVPQRRACWQKLRSRVRARARPGRAAHRGRGRRGAAQGVGQGAAGPDRHRARPQPRLDRLLHVHQGPRRAGRRGARRARARVSIVRPSIIESALEQPHPGWIEGFKMAEPLILAYGRGELPEFPAAGDTIVDIVPVDHVVAAIVAVLAHPPEPGDAGVLPRLVGRPQPADVPRALRQTCAPTSTSTRSRSTTAARSGCRTGGSREPRASSGCSSSSEKAHKVANYVIGHAPRSDRTRDLARKLDQQGRRLEFLRRYLDLYREYAQAELRFDDATRWRSSQSLSTTTTASGSRSTPRSSTGTTTSARCTARRSPSRSAGSTRCGARGGRRPKPAG